MLRLASVLGVAFFALAAYAVKAAATRLPVEVSPNPNQDVARSRLPRRSGRFPAPGFHARFSVN